MKKLFKMMDWLEDRGYRLENKSVGDYTDYSIVCQKTRNSYTLDYLIETETTKKELLGLFESVKTCRACVNCVACKNCTNCTYCMALTNGINKRNVIVRDGI